MLGQASSSAVLACLFLFELPVFLRLIPLPRSYKQAYAALEDILRQQGNEAASEHFQYPWPEGHESVYLKE